MTTLAGATAARKWLAKTIKIGSKLDKRQQYIQTMTNRDECATLSHSSTPRACCGSRGSPLVEYLGLADRRGPSARLALVSLASIAE